MANRIPWPKHGERQYRIVRTINYCFVVQIRTFWMPFWRMPITNLCPSLEAAETLAEEIELAYRNNGAFKYLGVLTPRD